MKHLAILLLVLSSFVANAQLTNTQKVLMKYADNSELSYIEVSDELFKMISKKKELDEQFKYYTNNLSFLIMVESSGSSKQPNIDLFKEATNKIELSKYKRLTLNVERGKKYAYYKRKDKNDVMEYLFISNKSIVYLQGTLTINSLVNFNSIIKIAASIQRM